MATNGRTHRDLSVGRLTYMCTVTFIARRNGYALGMNRDEKLTRAKALPPALHRLEKRTALYPSEPGGGTWIGVNDACVTIALINWYSVTKRVGDNALSRGEIVASALSAETPERANETLNAASLQRVNPFRLIGVFPASRKVMEWRWDLKRLKRLDHPWSINIWISSGFDESGAQQTRGKVFRTALRQASVGSLDWLRRLHRSHTPEIGPYSICMHRDDAATLSYTEITVSGTLARMHYQPASPCSCYTFQPCTAAAPASEGC